LKIFNNTTVNQNRVDAMLKLIEIEKLSLIYFIYTMRDVDQYKFMSGRITPDEILELYKSKNKL